MMKNISTGNATVKNSARGLREITGDSGKVGAFLKAIEPFGVKELAQSGLLAVGRGGKSITERVLRG